MARQSPSPEVLSEGGHRKCPQASRRFLALDNEPDRSSPNPTRSKSYPDRWGRHGGITDLATPLVCKPVETLSCDPSLELRFTRRPCEDFDRSLDEARLAPRRRQWWRREPWDVAARFTLALRRREKIPR